MSDFYRAIGQVLQNEGGYSNDEGDPGGETNWGICKRSYPNIDIKHLTKEQATEIYHRDFWLANNLQKINSQLVAGKVLDMCVNMGSYRGAKILQASINALGGDVAVDGVIGTHTAESANSLSDSALHEELIKESIAFYEDLVRRKPQMKKFMNSWMHRAKQ